MTDETYSCWMAFGALAAAGALWAQFMRARSMKRLLKLLREQPPMPAPEPAALLQRAVEQLELAKRLLTEADNVGLWIKADDASDNREKRTKLQEADWAASDAQRALAAAGAADDDVRALVAILEPLPDMVTDAMLSNPALDEKVRDALARVDDIAERLRRNLPTAAS